MSISQAGITYLLPDLELSQLAVSGLRDYSSLSESEKARLIATFIGISLLFAKRVSQMARGIARAAAMDGLGTLDNELGRCAGPPRVLERTRLSLRRGIWVPRRERSYEKRAASRREADGSFQHWWNVGQKRCR